MKLSRKGFTLIELIITMLIIVIVFGILANLIGFSTKFFRDENTQIANQTALRQIAVTFEKDIRRYALDSSQIVVSGSCHTLGATIKYCYTADKTITRNDIVIAEGIKIFAVSIDSLKVHLRIETFDDSRNQPADIEYDVYFRTKK